MALTATDTTVLIDGVEYTNNTIDFITIGCGRSHVWEQPRSNYAQISLFNPTNTNFPFDLNSIVIVKTKNATGTDRTLFTGTINSFAGSVQANGAIGQVGLVQISALGELARMSRILVGQSGYPKQYDEDRMTEILTEAGVTIDIVDGPGVYEFTSYAAETNNAYTLASKYADMAFGYIYETTDGKIGFANESRRTLDVAANGYDEFPKNYILYDSVNSEKTSADVINDVVLSYKANATVQRSDAASIATYGKIAANISTELEKATEAGFQADRWITLRAEPETNLEAFSIQLLNPNITNADIDILLQMFLGKPIAILGLPNSIIHTAYEGFVEGWKWEISRTSMTISINSTSSIYSLTPTRWQDVNAALIWSAVNPTLQWYSFN